jgi:predicted nucleic acid-binding Zn ribbon protein
MRKLVSASSFVLKGSGWYRDSYGLKPSNGKTSKPADSGGSKPVNSSKPTDTKSESKAA